MAKKILFPIHFFLFLLVAGLANGRPAQASGNLEIIFQNEPLFSQTDFLPGDRVTRWVKIFNRGPDNLEIGVKAANFSDPEGLGGKLTIAIEQDGVQLYTNSLAGFFAAGEIPLTSAPVGESRQYDLSVAFNLNAPNADQGRILSFDLVFGSLAADPVERAGGQNSWPTDRRAPSAGSETADSGPLLAIQAKSDQTVVSGSSGSFQIGVTNIGAQTAANVVLE
ncbi:hypothetical protein COX69_03315 [Candidatus Falkowbacteria bacterium CG_4_10_14_0_2_um_filter_48_10]|uniref:DUF11 domain-containing protein n=1 Tax=Candidatus Falkowbacteria bacterium CG23_combo_of_CG06-09_8_20_14_all_49_15 TaxID=1974572 RepID=A0A2G9ZMU6_9BACT|nr:MAG: hypothetical protein COX22_01955 [Candidatus Falkowbacteria bacterium CG23_combo_of_CG06-09_8_20_14_all_49_15]PJA08003.1 MAG: hypothetical protein COX69_03315 [Candidatus Falkowbacteria bacterium CG_4_10_14_0_2_um_filter_48_10]